MLAGCTFDELELLLSGNLQKDPHRTFFSCQDSSTHQHGLRSKTAFWVAFPVKEGRAKVILALQMKCEIGHHVVLVLSCIYLPLLNSKSVSCTHPLPLSLSLFISLSHTHTNTPNTGKRTKAYKNQQTKNAFCQIRGAISTRSTQMTQNACWISTHSVFAQRVAFQFRARSRQ